MSDAAIERLSKLLTDTPQRVGGKDGRDPRAHQEVSGIALSPAEGWLLLLLLAAVLYSTIWSVQAAGWIANLSILSVTTAVGLIIGVVAAKQRRFPQVVVYGCVIGFGLLLAFWQTVTVSDQGSAGEFIDKIHTWFSTVSTGGSGNDDAIFLFFIVILGYILAAMSAWLVYRMRSPWLMVAANAVVLLINLNNMSDGAGIFFLVLFLIASLLLLLRFNLYESITRWQRQGLRFADDLGWDIMQAGALISIVILVFSWILPAGYVNPTVSQIWSAKDSPFLQLQNTWNRALSPSGGPALANHGNFRDSLSLGGNPNLNDDVVLTLRTTETDTSAQYLELVSYLDYNNGRWTIGSTTSFQVKANVALPPSAVMTHTVKQEITLVNPPGEQNAYILGASEMTSISLPATVLNGNDGVVAWIGANGALQSGTDYKVTSEISAADVKTLSLVPLPKDAPKFNYDPHIPDSAPSIESYSPNIVRDFTQIPHTADQQRITDLAQHIIKDASASTMYDQAVALEDYLHKNYHYSVDIHPPGKGDPVAWFLFDNSNKTGFCNYFASAMALLARSLGIPARMVAGYAPGVADKDTAHQYTVRGKQAHTWTQLYFAGYGWINFEPSPSFASFTRPLPGSATTSNEVNSGSTLPSGVVPPDQRTHQKDLANVGDIGNVGGSTAQNQALQRQQLTITLSSLILLALFGCIALGIWWKRLFRRYSLPSQIYGRISVLARGAGIRIQPSQTPYEYIQELAVALPAGGGEVLALERLGDIYVRERWANPDSKDHPVQRGEIEEVPAIWKRLRLRLILYMLRHPYFLHWLPDRSWRVSKRLWHKRRARKLLEKEL